MSLGVCIIIRWKRVSRDHESDTLDIIRMG